MQVGTDIDGEAEFDQSGWSVALSADGARLARMFLRCTGREPDEREAAALACATVSGMSRGAWHAPAR